MMICGCNTAPPRQTDAQPTASVSPSPSAATCTNEKILVGWSVERLALQTITVPVNESSVLAVSDQVAAGVGGVILFGSTAPATLRDSLANLVAKAPGEVAPLIMVDEEGGAVQRMENLVGDVPSARTMGTTMTPDQIREVGRRLGERLRANGVTMDLAPVLDLDDRPGPNAANPDGTRSFSLDKRRASADGLAFAEGLRLAGVMPVVKHFPGLGYASANTDKAPATTQPWSILQQEGLVPFRDAVAAGLPAIMVANAIVPGLTTEPASLSSEAITTILREQLRFDGLIITDSLTSTAVSHAGYPLPEAAVQALTAGADMMMFTASASQVGDLVTRIRMAVEAAVASGKLTRQRLQNAAAHILALKRVDLCS
jgi:beta-N-acetylhexosaminidase